MAQKFMRVWLIFLAVVFSITPIAFAQDDKGLPRGNRLFVDDFSTLVNRWERQSTLGLTADYVDDQFLIDLQSPGKFLWSVPHTDVWLDRYVIDVASQTITPETDGLWGLVLHYLDDENFYLVGVSKTGYYEMWLQRDGEWQSLVSSKATLAVSDEVYQLQVRCAVGEFDLLLNETFLVTVVNNELTGGKFGLFAQANETALAVQFDDIAVYDNPQ